LVVALDTDMTLPDQIDTIELVVSTHGAPLLDLPLPVGTGPDTQPIPATLTLVAGPDPSLPVTIQVVGWKNGVARTIRQVVTTVPPDRVGTLRMPVQWLCDGTTQTVETADGGVAYQSSCGADATCKEGECVASEVDSSTLATYAPQLVFGGGTAPAGDAQTTGTCFDTIPCMVPGTVEAPDDQCTVALPAAGADVNVALRVAGSGICDTTGTTCFVPLDEDPEGWTLADGRIALPSAACGKLRDGLVEGVVVSTACATKTSSVPPCGSWSSVQPAADASAVVVHDAAVRPMPTVLSTVVADGGASSACCPLMADSAKLYTCVCRGSSPVQVVSIDPSTGATADVAAFSPSYLRAQYEAVLASGEVWWVDRGSSDAAAAACPVYGTSIADAGTDAPLAVVDGDIYDGANILADANDLYVLADNVSGLSAVASPVQLLGISRATGTVTPFNTGGATAVVQFTQDANAVYTAVDTDEAVDGGVERVSQIVEFPKSGAAQVTLVSNTLTTTDTSHGGFIGLQDDGTSLFALLEAPPAPDGTVETQVLQLSPADAGSSLLYEENVNPAVETMQMLGAVNGAVVVVRVVTVDPDGGSSSPRQSSVLVIPPGGGSPRIVASFVDDQPIFGLQTPPFTPDAFWLSASGRVFRLPAAALQ
jgi:hypothetical protein